MPDKGVRFLPSVGAFIILSGLFTSTLTQQALSYEMKIAEASHQNNTATIDRATTMSIYNSVDNALTVRPYDTLREQQAVFDGISTPVTEGVSDVRPNCTSSHCTWPRYGSLAACGGVANLTAMSDKPLLKKLREITEKRLNSMLATADVNTTAGYKVIHRPTSEVFPVVMGVVDAPTGAFNDSITPLIATDRFIAYSDEMLDLSIRPLDMSRIKFLEIAFWWCTKTYQTEVIQGQATTVEISTSSQVLSDSSNASTKTNDTIANTTFNVSWDPKFYACYSAGNCNATYGAAEILLSPPPDLPPNSTETYSVHLWSGLTASMLVATTMVDSLLLDHARGVVASNGGGVAKAFAYSLLDVFLTTSAAVPPPETQMRNVQIVVENTAKSMTNLVKTGTTRLGRDEKVNGTAYVPQAFVKVRWEWMAMLAAQLVLTGVFLGATAGITGRARMHVVKSSSLATLCALDEATRRVAAGEVRDLRRLKVWARGAGVRLDQRGAIRLGDLK